MHDGKHTNHMKNFFVNKIDKKTPSFQLLTALIKELCSKKKNIFFLFLILLHWFIFTKQSHEKIDKLAVF